jgi:hypothetical protein
MSGTSKQVDNFLSRLSGIRKTGSGWVAQCPCRDDDRNPSLSVGQGTDGRVLVTCHRGVGCNFEQICAAVNLTPADLMPEGDDFTLTRLDGHSRQPPAPKPAPPKKPETNKPSPKLTLVESYNYLDANGELLFQKMRYVDEEGNKSFRQRKPDGMGGWLYSLGDIPKVLYNLPAVLRAKEDESPIWVVEGEKDANTLTELGIIATTMPNGAGSWADIHTEALAGATVEILADNDEVGREHARFVFNELTKAGCNAQIWFTPKYKDITDHLNAGLSINELEPMDDYEPEEGSGITTVISELLSPGEEIINRITELLLRDDLDPQQKILKANLIISASSATSVIDTGRLVQWNDFLNESVDESYDWLIPGLLERSERVIVVAAEGVGKTMLARQIGILCAAGLHPFSYQPMKAIRTLTIDLENPDKIIRRTSSSIAHKAMLLGRVKRFDAHLFTKPSGLDLMKAGDRSLLQNALDDVQPDLLIIGPLYKAFIDPGGRTSESIAIEVAKYLDTIRTVYKCGLWIEHHAPLGSSMTNRELRPFGSAVWSRWPEFGLSLQPDPMAMGDYVYDVRHFRGARDERQWPTKMKRGKTFPFEVIDYMTVGTPHERRE